MSLKKLMKGVPSDGLAAEGLWSQDKDAVTSCQVECINRLGKTLKIEQENYLLRHPEVKAMLESFIAKMIEKNKRKNILEDAAENFARPRDDILLKINEWILQRQRSNQQDIPALYEDGDLKEDIINLINTHYKTEPPKFSLPSPSILTTESSSFISLMTSGTTLSTPEPIPTPEPTLSETFLTMISNTVDKAIFLRIEDSDLNYDTAYIELKKAVELAMDIPVIDIKKDIVQLFNEAYEMFEFNIREKERILAEVAWDKRMRKKLKKTLRRLNNFKGYEIPPSPKSGMSSHESYKIPPARPCTCHPQFKFNRYPKDRFGIYLPRKKLFSTGNITVTPAISGSSDDEHNDKISVLS